MPVALTPEYAETVRLSWNPLKRDQQVAHILGDRSMVGEGVVIDMPPFTFQEPSGDHVVRIGISARIFLGRRALRQVARQLDMLTQPEV